MEKKKEEREKSCCEKIVGGIVIGILGIMALTVFALLFMVTGQESVDVGLSQEVADEICMQLTGEDFVVASDDYSESGFGNGGGLICDVLSGSSVRGITVNR